LDEYDVVLGQEFLIIERVVLVPHIDRFFILLREDPMVVHKFRADMDENSRITSIHVEDK